MKILGIDPGTTNTGVCLVENNKVMKSFLMEGNIPNIDKLNIDNSFDLVVIEAYVYYGTPTNSEKVNRFIGGIEYACHLNNVKVILPKAVDWQYYLRKHFKWLKKDIGKSYKKLAKDKFNLDFKTEHEADAYFLALYGSLVKSV